MHSTVGVWSHFINPNGVLELMMSGAVLVLLLFEICEPDLIVFVDNGPMRKLMCLYLVSRAYVILKPDFPFPLAYYLIPFTGVVGMIILVMVIILVSGHSAFCCFCPCCCHSSYTVLCSRSALCYLFVWLLHLLPTQFAELLLLVGRLKLFQTKCYSITVFVTLYVCLHFYLQPFFIRREIWEQ